MRAAFAAGAAFLLTALVPAAASDSTFFVGTWQTWSSEKPLSDRCADGTRFDLRDDGTFDVVKLERGTPLPAVHVRFVPEAGPERARIETLDKEGYSLAYVYVEFVDADTWRDGLITYGRCKVGRPT